MSREKYYIGMAATFHDPSIAILDSEGNVLFAEGTERHLQNKRAMGSIVDSSNRIQKVIQTYCRPDGDFHVAFNWSKQYLKILQTINFLGLLQKEPKGITKYAFNRIFKSMLPDENLYWFLRNQCASLTHAGANLERLIRWDYQNQHFTRHYYNHHKCHAAAAIYGSGMEEATCVVIDGIGELGSVSYFSYQNDELKQLGHHRGHESLGFFYTILTYLCGFNPIEGEEWKVMGLAPYGKINKRFYDELGSLFQISDVNIHFRRNPSDIKKVIERIENEIKGSNYDFSLKADLAHTGQQLFTEYTSSLLSNIHAKGMSDNLVYAGGCALNSSFNGVITELTPFRHVYIPSAPGDDGTSVGAAYLTLAESGTKGRPLLKSRATSLSPYLGSKVEDWEIEDFIRHSGYRNIEKVSDDDVCKVTAQLLSEGAIVGWMQGRAEFGPRALGNRSILADPRQKDMKDKINSRVKFREEFRPFAPSILEDFAEEYFENYQDSPYMERTLVFRENVIDRIPAVVHENRSGRLQTVKKDWNKRYHSLITEFYNVTGVPILLNTSFNIMGKPIIHSVKDALTVYFNSGLDVLVVNNYIIKK